MSRQGSSFPVKGEDSSSSRPDNSSIILSSRAGISRNLSNKKFPSSCSKEEKNQVINLIRNCARRTRGLLDLCFLKLSRMSKTQRQVLLGDYQIEEDFISNLSIFDLLLNCGNKSLAILEGR